MERQTSFNRDELLQCGRGELFGLGRAQLPLPNMLMMDRIVHIGEEGGRFGRGEILAELDVDPNLWFFSCHFLGDPVMPGCLMLDGTLQLTGFFLAWLGHEGKGRALGIDKVKFTGQVFPSTKKVTYRVDMRRVLALGLVMGLADAAVLADDREICTATGLRVGLFSREALAENGA